MAKPFKSPSSLMVFLCSALLLLVRGNILGQTVSVPVRDPNAVALASRALQAMVGGTPLTDITLQGSAIYIAGSDQESGTATLVARSNAESLLTLNLSGGQKQEIRYGPQGVWIGPDGTPHAMALFNCYIDANWFFPALSLAALASDPTLVITLVGQEVHAGQAVYHLTLFHYLSGQAPDEITLAEQGSLMNLYLDANSFMPAALDFNIHPDNNPNVDIPVEIRFGAYQSFNGTWAPTRIQKYVQNSLVLDLTVTTVAANSGVSDNTFTLPSVSEGGLQ